MRFKRGGIRQSCDYCKNRRVKCDRIQKIKEGKRSCSQCEKRGMACTLNDIDIRRRPNSFDDRGEEGASSLLITVI